MKVFISWSGVKSNIVATALRHWIPDVIQKIEPWMSQTDIDAGARWNRGIDEKLGETKFGIICLTRSNQSAPWILFEAGALAKTIEDTFVCPYLIDLDPANIPQGPLTQFQAKRANEKETWELVSTINKALKDGALPEENLKRGFERWWTDLKHVLETLPVEETSVEPQRPVEDMVEEVLDIVRGLTRRLAMEPRLSTAQSTTPTSNKLTRRIRELVRVKGYQCVICGSTEKLRVRHIIPLSKGGTHNINNLEFICAIHNP